MKSAFFIVADLGNLKAWRLEKTSMGHRPRLELVEAFGLVGAHLKPTEMNTDTEGRYRTETGARAGQVAQGNSMGERHFELEERRRLIGQLVGEIDDILSREKPDFWSFAAPGEIQESVMDALQPVWRERLVEKIPRDLVNVPPQQLLEHFSAVRA